MNDFNSFFISDIPKERKQQVIRTESRVKQKRVRKTKTTENKEKELKCCALRKHSIGKFSEGIGNKESDLLILVPYFNDNVFKLESYLDANGLKNKYYIYPTLLCKLHPTYTPNNSLEYYIRCRKLFISKFIQEFNPRAIITFGNALYSITQEKFSEYFINYKKMYSNEFKCYIFPCPDISKMLGKTNPLGLEDNYYSYILRKHLRAAMKSEKIDLMYNYKDIILENENQVLEKFTEILESSKVFVYDIETDGLSFFDNKIISLQFCSDHITSYFIDFNLIQNSEILKQKLIEIFDKCITVAHNGKFDNKFLRKYGIYNAVTKFDTMLAHHVVESDLKHDLKTLSWCYTQFGGYEQSLEEYKKKNKIKNYAEIPREILYKYGCMDVRTTYLIYNYFNDYFNREENSDDRNIFYNLSMQLSEVLTDVEMNGILIDMDKLNTLKKKIKEELENVKKQIYLSTGRTFNIDSRKELLKVVEELKLPKIKETGKGGFSLDNKTYSEWNKMGYELGTLLLKHSELTKLYTTYIGDNETKGMYKYIKSNNRVYPTFNIHGTATGRLSSSDPNFQNQPKDKEFRSIYTTPEGYVFIEADLSQAELRVAAIYSGDKKMIEAFRTNKDIHCATLAEMYRLDYNEVYEKYKNDDLEIIKLRKKAKTVNFGVIYGETEVSLSESLGISVEEAKDFLLKYFHTYSGLNSWRMRTIQQTKKLGYTKTLFGRKRKFHLYEYIKNLPYNLLSEMERQSLNTPIQGSASDYTLLCLISLHRFLKQNNFKTKIIGTVHDSIVFEAYEKEVKILVPRIKYIMENIVNLPVKMEIDVKVSKIWGF